MGFKEFESLCYRDCGAGHVNNYAQHPLFFFQLVILISPSFYLEIGRVRTRWKIFQCRMWSWAEVNHFEPQSIQKNQNVQCCPV